MKAKLLINLEITNMDENYISNLRKYVEDVLINQLEDDSFEYVEAWDLEVKELK